MASSPLKWPTAADGGPRLPRGDAGAQRWATTRRADRRRETLRDLQFIVRLSSAARSAGPTWCSMEGYKARRVNGPQALAMDGRSGAADPMPVTLEPMPAHERRIIHLTLRDDPDVYTESTGEDEAQGADPPSDAPAYRCTSSSATSRDLMDGGYRLGAPRLWAGRPRLGLRVGMVTSAVPQDVCSGWDRRGRQTGAADDDLENLYSDGARRQFCHGVAARLSLEDARGALGLHRPPGAGGSGGDSAPPRRSVRRWGRHAVVRGGGTPTLCAAMEWPQARCSRGWRRDPQHG